jgi:hypothetical protein
VGTEVLVHDAVTEHVVTDGQHRGGESEDGLLGATPGLEAKELGLEVAVLLANGRERHVVTVRVGHRGSVWAALAGVATMIACNGTPSNGVADGGGCPSVTALAATIAVTARA